MRNGSMKDSYIPQHLDEPERYLVFTPDELAVLALPLGILTIVANFLVGLIVGMAGVWLLRKIKKGAGLNGLLWMAYWLLPSEIFRLKATPPSHLRELAG